jgi:hypothetical protein
VSRNESERPLVELRAELGVEQRSFVIAARALLVGSRRGVA